MAVELPSSLTRGLRNRAVLDSTNQDGESQLRSGIFGDLFDLLSRPSSAVAGGVRNVLDDNDLTTFLGGAKEGILGREQTSFRDVLKDQGVGGKTGAAAGFGLDVLLDPLTYVGIKSTKGTNKASALVEAMKLGSENVDNVAADILAKNPSRIGLTVAGKEIASFRTGKTASKATEALLGPVTDRRLGARMFSREAELPLGLNEMSRVLESANNNKFNDFRQGVKSVFEKDLTPEERSLISLAIEKGESLDSTPVLNANAKFKTLGEYKQLSQRIMDDFYMQEASVGLFKPLKGKKGGVATDYEGYNPNYVYRYFRKPPEDLIPGQVKPIKVSATGPNAADFMMQRKANVSLEEAQKLGYDPVTDIAEILDLRAAKHYRTTARATFVRDAVEKFGVPKSEIAKLPNGSQVKDLKWHPASMISSPITENATDVMLPEFAVRALNQAEATFRIGSVGNDVMRGFDKAMSQWKFLNTAASPGYHIRNSFSDFLLNVADGVYNPTRYEQARKVLSDVEDINQRTLLQIGDATAKEIPKGSAKIKLPNGQTLTSDEVWDLYGRSGSKSGLISSELSRSLNPMERSSVMKYGSKAKAAIGDAADKREDFFRLAHFIDSLGKTAKKGRPLEEAAMEAGRAVRKYNIDYGNLSSFEKNVATRVIPFYSWIRRATPLNMELLFTKPGFMALYPKGQGMLQGMLGTEEAEGEQLVPQWIKEMAPVRVALAKEEAKNPLTALLSGKIPDIGETLKWASGAKANEPAFVSTTTGTTPFDTLDLPLEGLTQLLQGDLQGARTPIADLWQGVSPLIKAPTEITTGRNMFTDQEITDWQGWLAGLVGPTRVIDKGVQLNGATPAFENKAALTSFLTGVPIQVATAARQESEFNRRQDAVQERNRQAKLQTIRSRVPGFDDLPEARREALLRGSRSTSMDPEARQQRRYLTQILGQ
jgi:hypothetical protein